MNIEVGKAYITRSGKKATVDGSTGEAIYEFSGRIDGKYQTWNASGSWRGVGEHSRDLISEWQEPEPELKIEAGKFYVTRDWRKARVDATDYSGDYPICGGIYDEDVDSERPYSQSWTGGGIVVIGEEVSDDIIGPWIDPPKPLEFWANVYGGDICNISSKFFGSEGEAIQFAISNNSHPQRTVLFREVIE
jgi:hypothetical protein